MRNFGTLIIRIHYTFLYYLIIATGNFLTINTIQAFSPQAKGPMRTIHRSRERVGLVGPAPRPPNAFASPYDVKVGGFVLSLYNFEGAGRF